MNSPKPNFRVRVAIDEYVHVGVRARLAARMRAEEVKRRHAEFPETGLGFLQTGNDVTAVHAFECSAFSHVIVITADRARGFQDHRPESPWCCGSRATSRVSARLPRSRHRAI